MANKNTAKIVGGFLAGAGIITYFLATKQGKKITSNAGCEAKKLMGKAEDKVADVKESTSSFADQVMDFVVSNRPMVESAVSSLVNSFLKKK